MQPSKNAVLPILASTIIANDKCRLHPVVKISDVDVAVGILEKLGAKCSWENGGINVDTRSINSYSIDFNSSKKMRASVLFLGALLARFGKAKVYLPGGCKIGKRPIDFHLAGFESLGFQCRYHKDGLIEVFYDKRKDKQHEKIVNMVGVSVGATENILMASMFFHNNVTIHNAAREPEIISLCKALKKYGARIKGAGSSSLYVEHDSLSGARIKIPSDRIVAGTFACCLLSSRGSGKIRNYPFDDLESFTALIQSMGAKVTRDKNDIFIKSPKSIKAINFQTGPHPAFPTDLQPLVSAVLCKAKGVSRIVETVFEKRFLHLKQLRKMGANVIIKNQECIIEGVENLNSAELNSTDLRCAAALIVAALSEGKKCTIFDKGHLKRGYYNFIEQLKRNGVKIS